MRLIDADTLLKNEIARCGCQPIVGSCTNDNKLLRDVIDEQPTTDIDKVVEQLKEHAIEFEVFGICSDYVELSHAIEIVKGRWQND